MNLDRAIVKLVKSGETVLDIGAHEGTISALLSQSCYPEGRVIAFEPQPDKFKVLSQKSLSRVLCEPLVVADRLGEYTLYYGEESFADQASTIVASLANTTRLGKHFKSISVQSTTIDQYCKTHELKPSFIKIDVEGAEYQVLKGSLLTLRECRPFIVFELGTSPDMERPPLVELLFEEDYVLKVCDVHYILNPKLGWDRGNVKTSLRAPLADHLLEFDLDMLLKETYLTNILAVPREKWGSLECGKNVIPWKESLDLLDFPEEVLNTIKDKPKNIYDIFGKLKSFINLY